MTREEVIKLLQILRAAYPNTKINDPAGTVSAWELAFGEDEADTIYKAARHYMNTGKFFPTIADIRKAIRKGNMIYGMKQEAQNNSTLVANTPTAPHKLISPDVTFCDLCELCDKHDQRLCDY